MTPITEQTYGPETNRVRSYYRGALVAPLVVHVCLAIVPSPIQGVMLGALVYGVVPYALWAVLVDYFVRRHSTTRVRWVMIVSPLGVLGILNILLVGDALFARGVGGGQVILQVVRDTTRIIGPWILAFGYFWVGLIAIGEQIARTGIRRRSKSARHA